MNIALKENYLSILLIILSVVGYLLFGYSLERHEFLKLLLLYTGLFFCTWRIIEHSRFSFWEIAGFGVLFRLLFLLAIPNLSQDFYRFLWDGRVLLQGLNPYLFTPEQFITNMPPKHILSNWNLIDWNSIVINQSAELVGGMGDLNASHYSNYPPINQLYFLIAALFAGKSILGSVVVLRVLIIIADVGILYFGKKLLEKLNLPVKNIFWYFLNPFIIIELTGNLHFEGVMLLFVVWSFYLLHQEKWFWAAVLMGVSISVKLLPLLFLPLFFKWFYKKEVSATLNLVSSLKFYIIVLGTVILTFAPFLSKVFISNFAATIGLWFSNFEFNASVYYIIRWIGYQTVGWNIIGTVGSILPLITIVFLAILSLFRSNKTTQQLITGILLGVSFYFLLSTTVHPWYVATPLILSVFTRYKFPIVWSFVIMLSYSAYGFNGFSENLWLVCIEYLVVIGFSIWEIYSISSSLKISEIK
ncbi:hypothetical protein ULMS_08250 [Patiriisocius marinistellae]|uniref:Mannosyltransferase n=1 Tax=Patiriisocius marinistellae TaxID=2494560 RepID=A0A5J4FSS6_9FLAO|nr:mannosyltransferase [Patiriisocius marinistellae]GEQ85317.1 hypothetical protein ULMS_08250 [Patiriisocius marinistellae]